MDEVREVRLHIVNTNTCRYVWDRDMRFRICAGPDDSSQVKGMCKVSGAEQPIKAYSHQAKPKKIKEQAKNKFKNKQQTLKKIFTVASTFARCQWVLRPR